MTDVASRNLTECAEPANRIKLTVCGSFGFGNAGDEAIPEAITDMAGQLGMPVHIDMVTRFDNPAMPHVIGLGAKDRHRLELLRQQPLIMSGGGIIDSASIGTIFRCERLLDRAFAPRSSLLGVSVEPGKRYGFRSRWLLRRCLRHFDKVYTRDKLSESTLNGVLPGVKTETVGDLVLWLQPDRRDWTSELRLPPDFIAVNLSPRWSRDAEWRKWISNEISEIGNELETSVVFFPMSCLFDDDRKELRMVADELAKINPRLQVVSIETNLAPRSVAAILSKARMVISMRLHGCVMAYGQRRPCVGLAYHPKLAGFFETIGWPTALVPDELPRMQRSEGNGYNFADLNLRPGDLVRKVVENIARNDFSMLPVLKAKSAAALEEFLLQTV